MDFLLLFQEAANTVQNAEAAKDGSFNLWQIIAGTTTGLMIFFVQMALSVITVYIFVERLLTIGRAGKIDESFMNNIRVSIQNGNMQAAKAMCQSVDAPMARMVEKGLSRIGKPLNDVHAAVENVGNLELQKLEKNLSLLASIAGLAPMIGLLGTVIGMIIAFSDMATASVISPQLLSDGIYHALIATAFGLVVGILSYAGYNYLVARLDAVVFKMENTTVDFIDLLQEPAA
jgi:biopolymer transport protein ExbB